MSICTEKGVLCIQRWYHQPNQSESSELSNLFFFGSGYSHMIIITTNQNMEPKNSHFQSEISLDINLILPYFYDLAHKPYFSKQWIVDAACVDLIDWINAVPEDIKLKTSNIYAKVSWSVKY